jgi:hypothetical protein
MNDGNYLLLGHALDDYSAFEGGCLSYEKNEEGRIWCIRVKYFPIECTKL